MHLRRRILIFSGDTDGIVPYSGTRDWIEKELVASGAVVVKSAMRTWVTPDWRVGGRVTEYDRLTLATVRDAGHMSAASQPTRTYELVTRFLRNQRI